MSTQPRCCEWKPGQCAEAGECLYGCGLKPTHVVIKAEAQPDHELGPCWYEEAAPIDRCAWDNFKPSKDLA